MKERDNKYLIKSVVDLGLEKKINTKNLKIIEDMLINIEIQNNIINDENMVK